MICDNCGEHALVWREGYAGSREEPPESEGFECDNCGHWQDTAPAGTMRRHRAQMAAAWARDARRRIAEGE